MSHVQAHRIDEVALQVLGAQHAVSEAVACQWGCTISLEQHRSSPRAFLVFTTRSSLLAHRLQECLLHAFTILALVQAVRHNPEARECYNTTHVVQLNLVEAGW